MSWTRHIVGIHGGGGVRRRRLSSEFGVGSEIHGGRGDLMATLKVM